MGHERQRARRVQQELEEVLVQLEIPKRIVLDTDILVDHLRSKTRDSLVQRLQDRAHLATTTVNTFELYLGAYKSRDVKRGLTGVKGLVTTLQVLPLTEGAAETAGKILADLEEKGQPIDARDMFVGAITLDSGYALLTRNKEHFARIKNLQLVTEEQASTSRPARPT